MKQLIFAVLCVAVAAGVLKNEDEEDIEAKFKAVVEKCNLKVILPKSEAAAEQEAKAHMFCILKGTNLADEHGNANVNEINKLTADKFPKEKLDVAAAKCKSNESSPIDRAMEFYRCLAKEGFPI